MIRNGRCRSFVGGFLAPPTGSPCPASLRGQFAPGPGYCAADSLFNCRYRRGFGAFYQQGHAPWVGIGLTAEAVQIVHIATAFCFL